MEEIYGILHKDYSSSHYIVLDDYFTKEQQLYFFDYFNKQQDKFSWYTEDDALDLQGQGDILEGEFILDIHLERFDGKIEYISEFVDYLKNSNLFKSVNRFQVIRQNTIPQHRDDSADGYHNMTEAMASNSVNLFISSMWVERNWFWFRLSDDKKFSLGKNRDIEFKNRAMIFNGLDYHGSPDSDDDKTIRWSILIKGTPSTELIEKYKLL